MVYISDCFEIYSIDENGVNYLHFMFNEELTKEASKLACEQLTKEINSNSSKVVLVWNCLCMEGFELSASKEWFKTLKINRAKIAKVITISDSSLTRNAIRFMLQMLDIPSEEVKANNMLALTPYLA